MQIHELTQQKKLDEAWGEDPIADLGQAAGKTVSGIKNVGSAIASPFKDIAGGYKDARMDQKVSAMADKAYRSWKSYEAQLLRATPDAKDTGELKQALLAFVTKNLLGGMYLPNVINKDKITGLVDQIAGGGQSDPVAQPLAGQHTGGKVAGQVSQTPGAVAKRNARAQTTQANTAAAGAFGQMAGQLAGKPPNTIANAPISKVNVAKPNQQPPLQQATALQQPVQGQKPAASFGKVPQAGTPVKVKGAARAGAPTPAEQAVLQQKIAAAAKKPTMNEAIPTVKPIVKPVGSLAARAKQRNAPATTPAATTTTPAATTPAATTPAATTPAAASANEKELFKQLVQQAALAQTSAPGTSGGGAGQATAKTVKGQVGGAQDGRAMAQTLRQQLDPAIVKSLPALGATAEKLTGSKQVSSTGNSAADGLLILMGFRGL
jgi:hypothetical protein